MKVAVTGARGFIGRHVTDALQRAGWTVAPLDANDAEAAWDRAFRDVDAVVHLAGANRPPTDDVFETVNAGLTARVTVLLDRHAPSARVVLSSTIHADGDTPYGRSKRDAELVLDRWAQAGRGEAVIFRFANVFGKWSRPDYNSVVATWCHRIARGLPYEVSDPTRVVPLIHVDDVVSAIMRALGEPASAGSTRRPPAGPIHEVTLGRLRVLLESFRASRTSLQLPQLSDAFTARLWATYSSYLPSDDFAYDLERRIDARGTLAEFIRTEGSGQVFVSRTYPGVTRGDHWHHTKVEKFLVLEGSAAIRFRHVVTGSTADYRVHGTDFRVVDIAPGWTHHIENIGSGEMVVLFWASETFDTSRPDTYFEPVGAVSGAILERQDPRGE